MDLGEQLASIHTTPPAEIPSRDGFHSTPLSWDAPRSGHRFHSASAESPNAMGPAAGEMAPQGDDSGLSEDKQLRLLSVAFNMGQQPASFMPSGGFGISFGTGLKNTSRTAVEDTQGEPSADSVRPQPKRSSPRHTDKRNDKAKPVDRAAHSDIERKYRTNLNDKIAELRHAVPSLHALPESGSKKGKSSRHCNASKVSKGTVLMKATEYIQHLEQRNRAIKKEHEALIQRLHVFETLLNTSERERPSTPESKKNLSES
ncbi:hypothetical protein BGZ61DRAFT_109615 [Ilyonectria robusta]|uniref:uncharacterized protein n=1 Tax=Ilyonectria robusta TaxID=1079257 RepID=UPI001E8D2B0D|nr:uncharacterized protein BGZ61DRAFT_109615 [Ilyonectria robusta]KAH8670746.1 hypothetical protein BGZ61DRAFT_109615 [Ilyonectria robusta]